MLQLTLPPELEARLRQEAERRGQSLESVALQLLDQHLPPVWDEQRRAAAIAMLRQWREEDAAMSPEEAAENADLLRSLDEDRPSHRKLFTDLLKQD
jgi:hypothetical protein